MRKTDVIRFAGGNFLRRKARSALTVLGVVIGTMAVVIMLSIGIGMNKGFEDQVSSYGDLRQIQVNELWGTINEETGEWVQNESREPLDDIALENIRAIKHVKAATPLANYWGCQLIMDNTEKAQYVQVNGIDAATMEDFGYEVLYGRLLNESDIGTNNFVMRYCVPSNFFTMREDDPIWYYTPAEGEELPFNPLDNHKYQMTWYQNYGTGAVDTSKARIKLLEGNCVGILVQNVNEDYQASIYMDVASVQAMQKTFEENQSKYYGGGDYKVEYYVAVVSSSGGISMGGSTDSESDRKSIYDNFCVMVDDQDHVQEVEKAIAEMGYETSSNMQWLTTMQDQTKFLRSILGAIGVVAFIVAAISIANTMVMSIYERTREIGIMKVLGCKLSDIRSMFLIEAAIIGITGGALGVVLSYGASFAVNTLAKNGGMSMMGIDAATSSLSIIPPWLDLAALVLATIVGVVSGLYPAIRATRLSALEAIKNE